MQHEQANRMKIIRMFDEMTVSEPARPRRRREKNISISRG